MTVTPRDLDSKAKLFAALGDPVRLRILEILLGAGEQCGTDLAEGAGISLALLCHHSKILVEAGAITKRKAGQSSYYVADRASLRESLGEVLKGLRK